MTDGWPLYESRLKGKLHRYTQRIERHKISTSVTVVLKIGGLTIGQNIKHYQ